MPYVIQRADKDGKPRYTGMYRTKDGPYRSAGTYDDHRRAYEVAEQEEQHIHSLLQETSPADKARTTFLEFGETRLFPRHRASAATMQGYFSVAQLYIYPYLGRLRVSEVNRETYYNLLIKTLPQAEVPHSAILATRKVLSAMCEMAWNEGYRSNNPVRSIRLPSAPTKPVLVASHDQWHLLEEALTYPPARSTPASTSPLGPDAASSSASAPATSTSANSSSPSPAPASA
ncbi:hypothetical protein [Actinocorallia sp. A-T 12471]|uniref:hypothetical protein n=1 Tax=Actinocorallia sp. A-T 12471 TaxID=3089813 RepID=UPI0029CE3197|nr:hypothetical protein [Actinocorallia sp. A-T 12471]MDX6738706.1 hypothetical protein [Actinocorallia sp. A-T 12471]